MISLCQLVIRTHAPEIMEVMTVKTIMVIRRVQKLWRLCCVCGVTVRHGICSPPMFTFVLGIDISRWLVCCRTGTLRRWYRYFRVMQPVYHFWHGLAVSVPCLLQQTSCIGFMHACSQGKGHSHAYLLSPALQGGSPRR